MGSVVTVVEATYIATEPNQPPQFIGLWFHGEGKPQLLLFPLDRTDVLALKKGDKGSIARNGEQWEFTPRGKARPSSGSEEPTASRAGHTAH